MKVRFGALIVLVIGIVMFLQLKGTSLSSDSILNQWPVQVIGGILILWLLLKLLGSSASSDSVLGLGKSLDGNRDTLHVDDYTDMFDKGTTEERMDQYETVVNTYYDLATDFYEYGWGTCFHFAQRSKTESHAASLSRHEHFLALKLGLEPGETCLDVGCGVGGPAREIARFSGAHITGLNNNAYQIMRGEKHCATEGVDNVDFIKGDFMNIPVQDNTYDAAYAIEATCHAPDRVGVYSEILRTIKPGGYFACYEWCMSDETYDKDDEEHQRIKKEIEVGNGLPDICTISHILDSLREAGFEVMEYDDLSIPTRAYPIPWYTSLKSSFSLEGIKHSIVGRSLATVLVAVLETIGLAPRGTWNTQAMLIRGADGLVAGGEAGIFTPMFYFLVKKPKKPTRSRSRSRKKRR